MSKNILPIVTTILVVFLSLKLFTYVLWQASGDGGTLVLTMEKIVLGVGILVGLGAVIGFIWNRLATQASDEELKIVGGGVLGLTFLSGFCLSGLCIPAAAISSIFTVLYLVPTLIGLKIVTLFYPEKKER